LPPLDPEDDQRAGDRASATGIGANNTALIALPNNRPSTAAGTNAIATLTAKRCATCREESGEFARESGAELPADGESAGLNDDLEHFGVIAGVASSEPATIDVPSRRSAGTQ
jgi:hypothetical protein